MTYPLIGNYGTNSGDVESRRLFVSGFVVKENCTYPNNWRDELTLSDYLAGNNIVGLEGIDTRKLVKHIRTEGAMRGIISSTELDVGVLKRQLDEYPGLVGWDIVGQGADFRNLLRPSDSIPCTWGQDVKFNRLWRNFLPQSTGTACRAPTAANTNPYTIKLKFGHRRANHPVKNLQTGVIEITSQNHGFCVDLDSLKDKDVRLTHINLNDQTLEGIRCDAMDAFSVQYHPEASPGPHDSNYLFESFTKMMDKRPAGAAS